MLIVMRQALNFRKSLQLKGTAVLLYVSLCFLGCVLFSPDVAWAKKKTPPPQIVEDTIIVGDRVVDIAFRMGVMPKAMVVRGSLWPKVKALKTCSQLLGCPNFILKNPQTLPDACKKFSIKRVIIEKSDPFCLYKPKASPLKAVGLLDGVDVAIEYVDMTKGLEPAIKRTASLMGCSEKKAQALVEQLHKKESRVKKLLSEKKTGSGTALILNGIYSRSSGKVALRVEAPGFYSDRFLLDKLGYTNVGDVFNPKGKKPAKGHFPVPKRKGGLFLDPLVKADPDVIVLTGDAFAVQKALSDYLAHHPELAKLKAVKNMRVYALPAYVDSSFFEYDTVLQKWISALSK